MLFLKSLILGLAIAAPLGPIGALCINRTLERGFRAGVAGGLGTALADALYASLAAAGFAAFASLLARVQLPLMVAGGVFLLWLGLTGMRPRPPRPAAEVGARDLIGTTLATFALTMTNPMTILSFAALFAGLGLAAASGPGAAVVVVVGVFTGSMLWWGLLSGGVALLRHRLPPAFALWVARISGAVLIGFGLWALASAARQLAGAG
ncbi:LysE family translocator [Fuscovulum blasticum]|uniref:LysE family translocator n=1 Tax=Fuscovulum blasticum TaxID=1075 RepID=UPI000D3EC669|nr:LysE family transporter [Fuscovulum blasticum]AWD20787.1 lysine transporter LysE [Fuscovulum blasticum]